MKILTGWIGRRINRQKLQENEKKLFRYLRSIGIGRREAKSYANGK